MVPNSVGDADGNGDVGDARTFQSAAIRSNPNESNPLRVFQLALHVATTAVGAAALLHLTYLHRLAVLHLVTDIAIAVAICAMHFTFIMMQSVFATKNGNGAMPMCGFSKPK